MQQDVIQYINTCDVCQRCKMERWVVESIASPTTDIDTHFHGLYREITQVWSIDTILVLVDRIWEFCGIKTPFLSN